MKFVFNVYQSFPPNQVKNYRFPRASYQRLTLNMKSTKIQSWPNPSGEGKRRNEFVEWHVAWLAAWHNYAEYNIRSMTQRNKLNWKVRPFLAPINFQTQPLCSGSTYDDNQKPTKAHCRLAFSVQPQRFFLPLLVGLNGSTDTTSRKSAIEEKIFWKVTLASRSLLL